MIHVQHVKSRGLDKIKKKEKEKSHKANSTSRKSNKKDSCQTQSRGNSAFVRVSTLFRLYNSKIKSPHSLNSSKIYITRPKATSKQFIDCKKI